MPRTLLDPKNNKYRKLIMLLNGAAAVEEKCPDDLGRAIGVCGKSASIYLKNPEKMTLERLLRMGRNLNIPIDELRESIRY